MRFNSRSSTEVSDNSLPNELRALGSDEARDLPIGAEHYTAFVGPPKQYDFLGASQFRLLCALGLREEHKLLDFGCGSLRAGRFLIPYLRTGCYYGLEPNTWLIEDGIEREVGRSLIEIKKPTFRHDDDFRTDRFGIAFDFILAQSIFSHTGSDMAAKLLASFESCLSSGGLIAATFVRRNMDSKEEGWVYPGAVHFRSRTIAGLIQQAGLVGRAIPWFHPRQTWYVMAREKGDLPTAIDSIYLIGAVLRNAELEDARLSRILARWLRGRIGEAVKNIFPRP